MLIQHAPGGIRWHCLHHSRSLTTLVREQIIKTLPSRAGPSCSCVPVSPDGGTDVDLSETPERSSAYACRCWCLCCQNCWANYFHCPVSNGMNHWPKTIVKICVCVCLCVCVSGLKGLLEVRQKLIKAADRGDCHPDSRFSGH